MQRWLRTFLMTGLAIAGSASVGWAQNENYILSQFDDPSEADIWANQGQWWGGTPVTIEWDGAVNATTTMGPNNAGSGSMKMTIDWSDPAADQYMRWRTLAGGNWNNSVKINGLDYTNCSFDIKVAAGSGQTAWNTFGRLEPAFISSSWGQIWAGATDLPVTTDWVHVVMPVDKTATGIETIAGFGLKMWAKGQVTLPQTIWIDNIIFGVNANKVIPPPSLTLQPLQEKPGLNIVAGAAGDYPREMVATKLENPYGWVGHGSQPVTYSMTINSAPDKSHNGFQMHMMLAPSPGTGTSPDWNEPNIVFVDIQGGVGGDTTATFRYKTNSPNGNTMIYNGNPTNGPVGVLGSVTSTNGPLGTWTVSFVNDVDITMTAPDGSTSSFSFPDAAAIQSLFADPVRAYFGIQKNGAAHEGQGVSIGRIQITGVGAPVNDTFPGPGINADPAAEIWDVVSDNPVDLFIVTPNDRYWVSWTLPDTGFALQTSPTLAPATWTDSTLTNIIKAGAFKKVMVSNAALPGATQGYYRMQKRVATKLQVLLPGETAAPGTATGKTGTPTAQQVGVPFDVIVNAVDNSWNVVTYLNDNIQLTSTDPNFVPADTALANGTRTVSVTLNADGQQTVTATDTTDAAKTPGVSSSVTVNP